MMNLLNHTKYQQNQKAIHMYITLEEMMALELTVLEILI
nr:MAG TPA: hypothetical protein [Caudoviricetes sp.]